MWKRFPNNSALFILFVQNNDYEILITDYLTLWFIRLTDAEFLNRLKESNTTLEINNYTLKSNGIEMLLNPDKLRKADFKVEGQTLQISMSMSFGYSFKLSLSLKEGSKEMFFQRVTQPLLKLVHNLKASENELRNLLTKKDLEIEEYKSEGAQVARHFKTSKFNDEQHMNQFKAYAESFDSTDIPSDILEKSVDLPENKILKTEPVFIKEEPREQTVTIKSEPETPPVVENHRIEATVSVKREAIKTETKSVSHDPRKRMRARLNL